MKKLIKPKHKKKQVQLQRLLLDSVPDTPVPAPYFTIPSPDPYRFPLGETMLQGIKLLQNYYPQDINDIINKKLGANNVQRMTRHKQTYCMLGKNGGGLIIGKQFLNMKDITAYSYGPNYLLIAFQDLRLEVYNLQLKLIKQFKKFFTKKTTLLKLLSIPKGYEGIIFISHDNRNVYIHRLEKSMLSKLSSKLNQKIIVDLQHPVTQINQMPKIFKQYLRNDVQYRDCSLICISSVNRIDVLRINHFRLDFEQFWDNVLTKTVQDLGSSTVSWGETKIKAPSRQMDGQNLVLVCSFAKKVIFLALQQVKKIHEETEEISLKFEWIESYPFMLKDCQAAFIQFIKKNQIILITDDNNVMIFNTKDFDIFEKPIYSEKFQIFTQSFPKKLSSRLIKTVEIKSEKKVQQQEIKAIKQQIPDLMLQIRNTKKQKHRMNSDMWDSFSKSEESLTELSQDPKLSFLKMKQEEEPQVHLKNIRTYADSFTYEYPSTQIFYMSQDEKNPFGVYVYCDWKLISDLLRLDRKYQQCMLFLIAIYKKANKFDLGIKGSQQAINTYIQQLAVEFINKEVAKLKFKKQLKGDIENILNNDQQFKTFIKPIEFLTQTYQFSYLFQVVQQKLIASLMTQNEPYHKQYSKIRKIFFYALTKFIQHGRIKYIPQSHLQLVFDHYISIDRMDIIDKLAIYFDLDKIDTGTVVQCLLQNDLTVSLAHICIQGNQGLFVTPFVKFWGVSANYRDLNEMQNATIYAIRALWYVKLCLQRNWALEEYSFQRYSKMISILSHHFLSQKIIVAMLQIRPQQCLQTLNYYFNIENAMIVNQQMHLTLPNIKPCNWIVKKEGNQQLQKLLSAINTFIAKANSNKPIQSNKYQTEQQRKQRQVPPQAKMNLFLSNIIIYRTVRFNEEKYYDIIMDLIVYYQQIKVIKYGLEDKLLQEFTQQYSQFNSVERDQILASQYIIRILTLIYYENMDFVKNRLVSIYEKSRLYRLMDLQAEICLISSQFNNAIDIYLRAKPNLRILIFKFLENAFKKLILEKKRNDKRRLGDILTLKIKSLVQLDSNQTKTLVDTYLPEIQEQLIDALGEDNQLQLQYLQQIIASSKGTELTKRRLSDKSILRYVELMSQMKPQQLLEAFKTHSYFPIDESIKICQRNEVYDCLQYLYQKEGSSIESVKVSIKRIDRILRNRIFQSSQQMEEDFTHYIKIKQILDHSIEVCTNTRSEDTWQALLDSSIQLYNKYQSQKFPEDEIEIFFFINGEIMEHLASNCPVQHTIDLLQNKYQNLNMGGKMTKAFITILANLSHSINILYIAESMIQKTYQGFLVSDYYNKISGVGGQDTCKACNFGIMRRKKSKHFHCHHSYHNQCILQQNPVVCVYCLLNQLDQFQYHINSMNSPLHPKLKKMREIFNKFNSQGQQMATLLTKQDKQQLQKNEDNVIITNAEKKRNRLKYFDQLMTETDQGNRRVLKELRMF